MARLFGNPVNSVDFLVRVRYISREYCHEYEKKGRWGWWRPIVETPVFLTVETKKNAWLWDIFVA